MSLVTADVNLTLVQAAIALMEANRAGIIAGAATQWTAIDLAFNGIASRNNGVLDVQGATELQAPYRALAGLYGVDGASFLAMANGLAAFIATATAPALPGIPRTPTAMPGSGSVTLNWVAPVSDGGSGILYYVVTRVGGPTVNTPDATPHITITGLTNGTAYSFTIAAHTAVGTGPAVGTAVSSPKTAPFFINAGGPALTDLSGQPWTADNALTSPPGGHLFTGTAPDVVAQTERYADNPGPPLIYSPVANPLIVAGWSDRARIRWGAIQQTNPRLFGTTYGAKYYGTAGSNTSSIDPGQRAGGPNLVAVVDVVVPIVAGIIPEMQTVAGTDDPNCCLLIIEDGIDPNTGLPLPLTPEYVPPAPSGLGGFLDWWGSPAPYDRIGADAARTTAIGKVAKCEMTFYNYSVMANMASANTYVLTTTGTGGQTLKQWLAADGTRRVEIAVGLLGTDQDHVWSAATTNLSVFTAIAQFFIDQGINPAQIIIRFAWEYDTSYLPWSAVSAFDISQYAAKWNAAMATMKSTAAGLKSALVSNAQGTGPEAVILAGLDMTKVDYIGANMYDTSYGVPGLNPAQRWANLLPGLQRSVAMAVKYNKPWCWPEMGLGANAYPWYGGDDSPEFVHSAIQFCKAVVNFGYAGWFDGGADLNTAGFGRWIFDTASNGGIACPLALGAFKQEWS